MTGRLIAADDTGATLAVDDVETTHPYADLGRGRIEIEFNRLDDVDDDDLVDFGDSDTEDERADVVGLDDDDVSDADNDDADSDADDDDADDDGEEDER